jgi:hypothetical protein
MKAHRSRHRQLYSFLPSTLEGDAWSVLHRGHLTHAFKTRLPLSRVLGEPQSQVGRFAKEKSLLPLLGFETQIVQSLAVKKGRNLNLTLTSYTLILHWSVRWTTL